MNQNVVKKLTVLRDNPSLTDSETLDEVLNCLVENISINTQGACDEKTLFEILIKAASRGASQFLLFQ